MIRDSFERVYTKFKINFYKTLFEGLDNKEAGLTMVETFCIEIIHAMGRPTVAEFAEAANISSPNAAYKVNNLVKKGYLKKTQSEDDKREYFLEVTDKFLDYYNITYNYLDTVMERVENHFSEDEVDTLDRIMQHTADELMPEVNLKDRRKSC